MDDLPLRLGRVLLIYLSVTMYASGELSELIEIKATAFVYLYLILVLSIARIQTQ